MYWKLGGLTMEKFARNTLLAVVSIGFLALFGSVRASGSDYDLKSIVNRYLAARQATMLETSTLTDVDHLLSFYAEDVVYEHPRAKMRIEGKANMREGMGRFLGATRDTKIVTLNQISNVNVVVAEYQISFKAQEENSWKSVSRKQVTLFEFEGNKIKRLVDYW
jgi:ketosteroid isomerase-like protein